jgi:nitrite reductase/ring-hydroxylating ferredoxin subunit
VRRLRTPRWAEQEGTWRAARPALIAAALSRAVARTSGNWFVLAGSREVTAGRPFGRTIAGREVVAWRSGDGRVHAGPGACPHLGAPLSTARVRCDQLVCRWHGLKLGERGRPDWTPFPAHDDGALVWVRLDAEGGEEPLPGPVVPRRPPLGASIDAVATTVGVCEPEDVIANRLDPWHGSWFHPYSFANLRVRNAPGLDADAEEDRFDVEVSFRVAPGVGVPVRARFTAPERRTVVMHIVEGEGAGSVVETHATPLGTNRAGEPMTAVIEATVAYSERPGFRAARGVAPAVRGGMRWAALRLWRDDLAYAERRFRLRSAGKWPS